MQQSLKAWDELVAAIEKRMPAQPSQRNGISTLVETTVAERWCDHPFQRAFLTQARAPNNPTMNIAPGVKPWTSSASEAIHANEPITSECRLAISNNPSDDHPQRESHREISLPHYSSPATQPSHAQLVVDSTTSGVADRYCLSGGRGCIFILRRSAVMRCVLLMGKERICGLRIGMGGVRGCAGGRWLR